MHKIVILTKHGVSITEGTVIHCYYHMSHCLNRRDEFLSLAIYNDHGCLVEYRQGDCLLPDSQTVVVNNDEH